MSLEKVLNYALGAIGALLLMLFGLVTYEFQALSSDVRGLQAAITDRLDKHETKLVDHDNRLVRLETLRDMKEGR
ncbi:hypothetical protein [Desulfovibrio falkowii]|uniref:hypothetical protein n=1 Tax=Desulfovibrio sp. WGS1351 TaxID=3366814 RepID=UPI00372D4A9D